MRYLFEGLSSRGLDKAILGLEGDKNHGYESWSVLRRYGLTDQFKGIFSGKRPWDVLDDFPTDPQYSAIYEVITGVTEEISLEPHEWVKGLTKVRLVKTRVNQDVFRRAVLDAYGGACCITGITEPKLLKASHIKPWSASDESERTDVCNGLCLNTLHDAAFDVGLMTLDPSSYCIRLSSKIEEHMSPEVYDDYFRRYDGTQINLPSEDKMPKRNYLDYHKQNVFDKNINKVMLEIEIIDN